MQKLKTTVIGMVLLSLAALGLYACGAEPATPTPTLAPPTSTRVPPTATNEPEEEPTETASNTGRSTPGTARTALAGRTPVRPARTSVPSGAGTAASEADIELIKRAITTTGKLNSYHYTYDIKATDLGQAGKLEGDYVAPDKGYVKGTIAGQSVEQLVSGGAVYVKDASGKWVVREASSSSASDDPTQLLNPETYRADANPIQGLNSFLEASSNYRDLGEETVRGAKVRHFSFELLSEGLMKESGMELPEDVELPSLGGGEVWVDPQTQYVHRVKVGINFGVFMELLARMMSQAMGITPTPGATPTPIPGASFDIDINMTRHNDPSITVPDAPAGSSSGPTATVATGMETTPEAMGSPEAMPTRGNSTGSVTERAIGETGQIGDLKVTVNNVRYDKEGTVNPDPGNEYMVINFTVENLTNEQQTFSTLLSFTVKDSTGKEYDIALFGPEIEQFENKNPDGVPAKAKATGEAAFEIPATAKGLALEYTALLESDVVRFKLDR